MFILDQAPLPPNIAIEHLAESRYGFSLVDVGVTLQDIIDFDQIEIAKKQDYSRWGELEKIRAEIVTFLKEIGPSNPAVAERVAFRVSQIAHQILEASGKETAWVWLRSSTPATAIRQFRWHFDWPYYNSKEGEIQYRFVMTLTGPPTRFYPLPVENKELRGQIEWHSNEYKFIEKLCDATQIFIPNRELGVLFMNGKGGGLHSEPPLLDRPRLFLSIIVGDREEMTRLEARVKSMLGIRSNTS